MPQAHPARLPVLPNFHSSLRTITRIDELTRIGWHERGLSDVTSLDCEGIGARESLVLPLVDFAGAAQETSPLRI